jgi:hypothetical protein
LLDQQYGHALFYGLAPTESPNDTAPTADNLGKDHRGMAVFKPTADYIDSGNKTFRTVDVFSLDTQFANRRPRESPPPAIAYWTTTVLPRCQHAIVAGRSTAFS